MLEGYDMKTLNTLIKILTALAAVAGAIYIVATYGEQIVAWAKRLLASLPKCPCCEEDTPIPSAPAAEEPEAAVPEEEAAVEEPAPAAEEPAPEILVADHEPVAEETDFAE